MGRERERQTADINVQDLISLPKRNLLSGIIDLSNTHIIKSNVLQVSTLNQTHKLIPSKLTRDVVID